MANSLWGVALWDSAMWNETDSDVVPTPLPGTTDLTFLTFHVSIGEGPTPDFVRTIIGN